MDVDNVLQEEQKKLMYVTSLGAGQNQFQYKCCNISVVPSSSEVKTVYCAAPLQSEDKAGCPLVDSTSVRRQGRIFLV